MPNTLIPIQTYTLTSSTASVTFSNIPQNYTDLKLRVSARQDNADNNLIFKPNGATTSITTKLLTGDGASVATNAPTTPYGLVGQTGFTASTFGSAEWTIPNYTSANYKSWSVDECNENNGSTSYLRLQAGLWSSTAAITSITLTAGSSGNFVSGSTFTLYGVSNGVKATGGTVICAGGYAYHTFTSTASFLPNQKIKNAETLVVAGGGGGGARFGGGGGAGGVRYTAGQTFNAGNTYTALVGSGGAGVASAGGNGTQGADSVLGSYTATGGGYGATAGAVGGTGGSGGGAGGAQIPAAAGGSATSGQGNNGGAGGTTPDNSYYRAGGGGGGAGAVGTTVVNGSAYGVGGIGTTAYSSWHAITATGVLSSSLYYIAAGGGGGIYGGVGSAAGGTGGGGAGSVASTGGTGVSGTANTGSGGGGGGGDASAGGAGGSGLIIVRYPLS